MKHVYKLNGATCASCKAKVIDALESLDVVTRVSVSDDLQSVEVEMKEHVGVSNLNAVLVDRLDGKYSISLNTENSLPEKNLKTYFPLILVVSYIVMGTFLGMFLAGEWVVMFGMRLFMGLFFLGFAFFKLLDVRGFAASYMSYDIVAAKWMKWGYIYPFVELVLGAWFMSGWRILEASIVTAIVMGVSLVGVVKSVLSKRTIKCACLGTGFNLPMSTVTIVEDGGMVLMAIWMIYDLIK